MKLQNSKFDATPNSLGKLGETLFITQTFGHHGALHHDFFTFLAVPAEHCGISARLGVVLATQIDELIHDVY
jgi:hypothetical protein